MDILPKIVDYFQAFSIMPEQFRTMTREDRVDSPGFLDVPVSGS